MIDLEPKVDGKVVGPIPKKTENFYPQAGVDGKYLYSNLWS